MMRRFVSLLRREADESRGWLLTGVVLFGIIPGTLVLVIRGAPHEGLPSSLMLAIGSIFAALLGVRMLGRNARSDEEPELSPRSMRTGVWVTAKLCAGLAVLLLVAASALAAELVSAATSDRLVFSREPAFLGVVAALPFALLAVYSTSFLIGGVVTSIRKARLLAIGAAVALYLVPIVVPGIGWAGPVNLPLEHHWDIRLVWGGAAGAEPSDTEWVLELPWHGRVVWIPKAFGPFVIAMVAVSIVALGISWWCVRRPVAARTVRRAALLAIGGAYALAGMGMWRVLGSNLDSLSPDVAVGEEGMEVVRLFTSGERGVLLLTDRSEHYAHVDLRGLDLSASPPELSPIVPTGMRYWPIYFLVRTAQAAWSPLRPDLVHVVEHENVDGHLARVDLVTYALDRPEASDLHHLELLPDLAESIHTLYQIVLVVRGSRLLVYMESEWETRINGREMVLAAVDLTTPKAPKLLEVIDTPAIRFEEADRQGEGPPSVTLPLPEISNLSPRERLEVAVKLVNWEAAAIEGGLLVRCGLSHALETWELVSLSERRADFRRRGVLELSLLEKAIRGMTVDDLLLQHRLVWVIKNWVWVYDVSRPERPRRIGQYGWPSQRFNAIAQLPNGNVLVGGEELRVLAPPRR